MPVGNPVTDLSTTGNFVPVTRTLTINGVSYDLSADRSWSIASPGGGSVTSVAMTVPTGFTVTGSPITTAGTLAVTFSAGYSLPTTVKQSNWDDAYTWVSNFPTQTGNAGKFLYTNGSVLSWQQALLNPFTVLGQIVYSGVSGSVEVLNGNTTTQRLYLQQVGTGTSSAAPSWGGIISTDITGQALTKTDDTNVTLTLGGTPGNSVLNAVSLTLGWAGTLAVSRGGSGAATLSGVLIGNGTSAFTAITGGPNQLLRVNGTATGFEFYSASFLTNPMTLNYDMIYQNAGIPARLPGNITTTKQYLTSLGNGSATTSLAWASFTNSDVPGDALTRVNDTNVTLTLGGTPSTAVLRATSLTLGWSGTLAVGRGGTGASTLTGVLIGNGTSAVTAVAGTAGQFLRRNLANTAYEFRTLQGGDIAGSELTFSNDTNVTMSLSGTPASALLQPVTIGLGWTGTLAVSRGGIGVGTITGVMIGNGTSAVTGVTGTANQILRRNAGNTAYEFWSANYMVNPMTLEGSIIYATTGGTPAELFANSTSTRKYLSQINGGAPTWEALSFPTGSGTTNYVAKWTPSGTVLGNSQIYDNGTSVIVGGTTAVARLEVNQSGSTPGFSVTGGTNPQLRSTDGSVINKVQVVTGISTGYFGTESNHALSIITNNTARINVTSGGDVGIGTNTPAQKLELRGNGVKLRLATSTDPSTYYFDIESNYNAGNTINFIGAAGTNFLRWNYNTQDLILNSTSGNVGVGVLSPSAKLDIQSSSQTIIRAVGTNASLLIDNVGSGNNYYAASVAHYFQDNSSQVRLQIVSSTGNVGIGISPSYKLDVGGTIGISGNKFAGQSGSYHVISDQLNVTCITIGGTDPTNAYDNTSHLFRSRNGSSQYASIGTSGVQTSNHFLLPSANYITWGGVYGTDIPTISGTSGGGTNGFLQFYPAGSTSGVKMALLRTGQLALPSYTTSTSFSGTAVATLAVTNAGDVITIAPSQTTASGTYTPTWTGLANVGSVTAFSCQYMRVGDTVTVSGWVTIDAVADNTPTSLSFSLPINSNTTSVNYLNGTGVQQGGGAAASLSGYGANYGEFEVSPLVDTAVNYSFHFTYRII